MSIDYKLQFDELLAFLQEYYNGLINPDDEGYRFFLSLSAEQLKTELLTTIISKAPPQVKEIFDAGEVISTFPFAFWHISKSDMGVNPSYFRGVKEKKRVLYHLRYFNFVVQ